MPLLVPQWDEGKRDTRDVPRYRLASPEEETTPPPKKGKRERPSRRRPRFPGDWESVLLLPFREGKPLFLLSLLLACGLGMLLHQLAATGSAFEGERETLYLAGVVVAVVAFQVGCWQGMLSAFMAGEHDLVSWDGWGLLRILKGMAFALGCFLAGPAWLLLLAAQFWLHGGDFTWIDWFLLGELVAAAAAYWMFCMLAVAVDRSLLGASPFRVADIVRRLGSGTSFVAACLAGAGAIVHGWLIWASLSGVHEGVGTWLWLMLVFFSAQVWGTYLLLWLGMRCSARVREPSGNTAPDVEAGS